VAQIENKKEELQSLQAHLAKLGSLGRAEHLCLLQGKAEDCFQLFQEAHQVVERRQLALSQLAQFLQSHASLSGVLHQLRQTVESTSSMNKKQSDLLEKDLSDAMQDVKTLESTAISLDGILTKAQYHLKDGSTEQRTSCRAAADQLCSEVERIQNLLGTKQSEADALAVLKKAFQDQKEELLKSIEDIEERTDRERLKEPTRQALQQRYRKQGTGKPSRLFYLFLLESTFVESFNSTICNNLFRSSFFLSFFFYHFENRIND
jgi:nesprin-1